MYIFKITCKMRSTIKSAPAVPRYIFIEFSQQDLFLVICSNLKLSFLNKLVSWDLLNLSLCLKFCSLDLRRLSLKLRTMSSFWLFLGWFALLLLFLFGRLLASSYDGGCGFELGLGGGVMDIFQN